MTGDMSFYNQDIHRQGIQLRAGQSTADLIIGRHVQLRVTAYP